MNDKKIRLLSVLFLAVCLVATVIPSGAVDVTFKSGDVNMDGYILANDARLTLRASANLEKLLKAQFSLADVNADGQVLADDARQILRFSAKLQSQFKYANNIADKEQADAAITQIKAFYDRKCYFEGKMFQNGEGSPMSIAFDGDNYEVYTQLDGIEISIMKKDGKYYMKRPAAKQYVELNDSLMSMVGLSMDDINVNFGSKNFNSLTPDSVYDVTINGQQGVCYHYKTESGYAEFYAVDGQLKEIDIRDSNLTTQTQLQIDVFSTTIPSDQLNVNGYTQAKSLFSMLSDMMR